MAQFVVKTLSKSKVEEMVNPFTWDYCFSLDKDEYLCLTDGITFLILSIDKQICTNITLIKYDNRILNFIDLAVKVLELPFKMYFFNSERRLGNKYQFITKLLGGEIFEKDSKYYYKINASMARKKIAERLFFVKVREYKPLCAYFKKFILIGLENISMCFRDTIAKLNTAGVVINAKLIENEYYSSVEKIDSRLFKSFLKPPVSSEDFLAIIDNKKMINVENAINCFIENIIRDDIKFAIDTIVKFKNTVFLIVDIIYRSKLEFIEIKTSILSDEIKELKSKTECFLIPYKNHKKH
ncbi:hypothetical protein FACS189442_0350 [Spirochaetia bacterium]|nr:hypothetical protein FACS189442_0350 [Spirochaetia bacterium]